ncbi:Putative sugar O-methyltransferase [Candidatus Pelagibacterales bacterium]
MIKKNKIYLKIRNYLCEYLGFEYRFFHRKPLLKLKYKIEISKEKTKLSNQFYEKIFNIINQKDEINKDSIWLNIFNNFHKNVIDIIKSDKSRIEDILDDPSKYDIFYGFDSNCNYVLKNTRYSDYFENDELVIDKILNFAEYLGILRHNNPERYRIIFKKPSLDNLINEIEKKINIELKFNNVFPGEKGVKTQKGIISNREIQAIYQAYKIKEIFKKNNYKNILEIGGGLGRTAYYCYKFGIKDYTIVDLLIPRVCQLNYLSRVLNEENIINESQIINLENLENKIKIISPNYLFNKNIKYDLIFNSDSITEIDSVNQNKYINFIKKNAKYFYSINHESNKNRVNGLFSNTNILEVEKNLYWLRRGYLEEHFKFI